MAVVYLQQNFEDAILNFVPDEDDGDHEDELMVAGEEIDTPTRDEIDELFGWVDLFS
jgi:hypothetical protein